MGDLISSLLFQPPPPTYLHPSRHFWITTSTQTRIPAFFIEGPNATTTILFSHGNAEDLGMIYDWFNDLARVLRVNILAYDYTGYGKSHGTPTEPQCYNDIDAAYHHLTHVRNIPPEQIVLYGRSLGSGPSCYLAAKTARSGRSVAGVILQSPLLSAFRVAFNFRFTVPGDRFPNLHYAPYIACPVFIVHGTQDEVVPFWHGEELFLSVRSKWRAKPFWVEGAGHNNIEALLRPSGALLDKLIEFLDLHVGSRKGIDCARPPKEVPLVLKDWAKEKLYESGGGGAGGAAAGGGSGTGPQYSVHGTVGDASTIATTIDTATISSIGRYQDDVTNVTIDGGKSTRSRGRKNEDGYENVDDVEQFRAGASITTSTPPPFDSTGGSGRHHHGNIPPAVSSASSYGSAVSTHSTRSGNLVYGHGRNNRTKSGSGEFRGI